MPCCAIDASYASKALFISMYEENTIVIATNATMKIAVAFIIDSDENASIMIIPINDSSATTAIRRVDLLMIVYCDEGYMPGIGKSMIDVVNEEC